jgi:hypothetical protein
MTVIGNVSLTTDFIPEVRVQLGPCRVHGLRITVDPLGARWSAVGAMSVSHALSVSGWAGTGGRVQATALVTLPGVPMLTLPIPNVGVELGLASQARATAAGTSDLAVGASGRGPFLRAGVHLAETLGVALDVGVGAYGLIDVMGIELCRFHRPFARHSLEGAVRLGAHGHLVLTPLGPVASLNLDRPRLVPFGSLPLAFGREVLADDCARLRTLCRVLHALGWMPSQSGGTWSGHPSPPWTRGPLPVLPRDPSHLNPAFTAGSKCRGACGPDCLTCSSPRDQVVCAPRPAPGGGVGHDLWIYPDLTTCGTHLGCRDHDACYDHCAQGGSRWGPGVCARLCDMECACTFPPANCVGWVAGAAPHDGRMTFSDPPYVASSCDIPCPQLPGGGGGGRGGGGGGAPGGGWGGGGSGGGGGGSSWSGGGGGFGGGGASSGWASPYTICLPTLELFGRRGVSDAWRAATPFQPVWGKWIVAPPPVLLVSLKLGVQGSATAGVGAGIGPATVNNVCFTVDPRRGTYAATGVVDIAADFDARLGVGGELCVVGSWIELIDVVSGCVGLEATGTLSARANLGGRLTGVGDLSCASGAPTLESDLGFSLDALLDFDMDVTFRLTTVAGIEVFSTRWNLLQAQWGERWGQGLDVRANPLGAPTLDLRAHRFGLDDLVRLLTWLLSDEAEESEAGDDGDDERSVVENPLTAARARGIPDLASHLDRPGHHAGTLTLLGGASATVGRSVVSTHITHLTAMGSTPRGQDELYGYGRLPQVADVDKKGYTTDIVFVKGHLLNYHKTKGLGGEGIPENLYPITGAANSSHSSNVESKVKELVHGDDKLVVFYQVQVTDVDGPHRIDVFDDDPSRECVYQYVNADFACEWATYRLYSDDTVELNDPESYTVDEDFNEAAFRTWVRNPGGRSGRPCPGKPE